MGQWEAMKLGLIRRGDDILGDLVGANMAAKHQLGTETTGGRHRTLNLTHLINRSRPAVRRWRG
jgi:hypothetical protein